MMHEEWILEVQIAMGKIAALVRQGESGRPLEEEIVGLRVLVKHWAIWTASDPAGKAFALQCADDDGVFTDSEVESR
jgi:hypothetical protein